jgi:uncharacterized lipoprotein YmbA
VASAALAALATLPACGSTPESRFYTLEPLAARDPAPADGGGAAEDVVVLVGPVELLQVLDRPQMVTRVGDNEVAVHEYDRWAEPLGQGIARVLAEDLGALLGSDRVSLLSDPGAVDADAWRLGVVVVRFEGGPDGRCALVARWTLERPSPGSHAEVHRSELTAEMSSRDGAGLAAAMSRNVNGLAREVAAALRGAP